MTDMQVIVLTREQLDVVESPVVVSGRCHPRSAQLVFYLAGVIAIRCKTCNKHVANVAIAPDTQVEIDSQRLEPGEDAVRLKGECHPKAGMFLAYDSGKIIAACGQCKHEVTKLGVKPMTGAA